MMLVKFDDGGELAAPDAIGIVSLMAGQSYDKGDSIEAYMMAYARRAAIQNEVVVRCDTVENFIASLVGYGFITSITFPKDKHRKGFR